MRVFVMTAVLTLAVLALQGCWISEQFVPNATNPGGMSNAEVALGAAAASGSVPAALAGPVGWIIAALGVWRAYRSRKLMRVVVKGAQDVIDGLNAQTIKTGGDALVVLGERANKENARPAVRKVVASVVKKGV